MIIAASGKRGTGKTTLANYLVREYGFKRVSFADKLKFFAQMMFPFGYEEINGNKKETPFTPYDWTPRDFLINLGQFMRYYDPNYWIKAATDGELGQRDIVIDDMRFKNEAEFLEAKGAILIRIERYKSHNPFKDELNDISETDLDHYSGFHYRINEVENRSLTGLYIRIDHIMDAIGKEKV